MYFQDQDTNCTCKIKIELKKLYIKKEKEKKEEKIPTEVKRLKSGITQQHYCVQRVAVRDVSSLQLINMQHSLGSAPLTPVITIS